MVSVLQASALLAGSALAQLSALGAWILYRRLSNGASDLAFTDPLTGLHNRRFLAQTIDIDIAQSLRRYRKTKAPLNDADLVFFFIDIDRFKAINDHYGHAAGDRVLAAVADVLRRETRDSDIVMRWGGEEFVVVERFSNRANAGVSAERLREAIASESIELADGEQVSVTCSIGFAAFPFEPADGGVIDWQDVLTMADLACYDAKAQGRNRCVGYHSPRPGPSRGALHLVRDEADEGESHGQPRGGWRAHRTRLSYAPTSGST